MPEGPEIRRMADSVADGIAGRVAEDVFFAFDTLRGWQDRLAGREIVQVFARGKALLVEFAATADDQAWVVYTHNQLYGKWRVGSLSRPPHTRRQLRFAVSAGRTCARLFSASDIHVVPADDLLSVPYIARLGPDPVNEDITCGRLLRQFEDKRFSGRNLGGLLLDQRFVAGLGNYLRSEILFIAGIDPAERPGRLTMARRQRLAESIITLTERAYRLHGITNDPAQARELEAQGVAFRHRRHYVFSRGGEPCRICATPIEKRRVASRRLYLCPICQSRAA